MYCNFIITMTIWTTAIGFNCNWDLTGGLTSLLHIVIWGLGKGERVFDFVFIGIFHFCINWHIQELDCFYHCDFLNEYWQGLEEPSEIMLNCSLLGRVLQWPGRRSHFMIGFYFIHKPLCQKYCDSFNAS